MFSITSWILHSQDKKNQALISNTGQFFWYKSPTMADLKLPGCGVTEPRVWRRCDAVHSFVASLSHRQKRQNFESKKGEENVENWLGSDELWALPLFLLQSSNN